VPFIPALAFLRIPTFLECHCPLFAWHYRARAVRAANHFSTYPTVPHLLRVPARFATPAGRALPGVHYNAAPPLPAFAYFTFHCAPATRIRARCVRACLFAAPPRLTPPTADNASACHAAPGLRCRGAFITALFALRFIAHASIYLPSPATTLNSAYNQRVRVAAVAHGHCRSVVSLPPLCHIPAPTPPTPLLLPPQSLLLCSHSTIAVAWYAHNYGLGQVCWRTGQPQART